MIDKINQINGTNIYVHNGDITQIPTDAIITAINSGGMWFGGIDGAIQRAASENYHVQVSRVAPLSDLQTIVASGDKRSHNGQFDDVVFVIDDLQSPLEKVIGNGLEASNSTNHKKVLIPTLRMGVMAGVRESAEEAMYAMADAVGSFVSKYGDSTSIKDLGFVVYNDSSIENQLRDVLANLK